MKFQVLGFHSELMGEETIRKLGEEFISEIEIRDWTFYGMG